ncbi:hypothetical protein [Streptacidiphilus sp. PAMC 29251]
MGVVAWGANRGGGVVVALAEGVGVAVGGCVTAWECGWVGVAEAVDGEGPGDQVESGEYGEYGERWCEGLGGIEGARVAGAATARSVRPLPPTGRSNQELCRESKSTTAVTRVTDGTTTTMSVGWKAAQAGPV